MTPKKKPKPDTTAIGHVLRELDKVEARLARLESLATVDVSDLDFGAKATHSGLKAIMAKAGIK